MKEKTIFIAIRSLKKNLLEELLKGLNLDFKSDNIYSIDAGDADPVKLADLLYIGLSIQMDKSDFGIYIEDLYCK